MVYLFNTCACSHGWAQGRPNDDDYDSDDDGDDGDDDVCANPTDTIVMDHRDSFRSCTILKDLQRSEDLVHLRLC